MLKLTGYHSRPISPAAAGRCAGDVPMLRDGRTFAEQDDRGENKVDPNMDHNRQPDDDAIAPREVKHQNIGADTELDQGHAVEVEELPEPEPS